MSRVRLWVDDNRPMPEGYTHWAKTAHEAIAILEECSASGAKWGHLEAVSLDHDLGEFDQCFGVGTGYEVACRMLELVESGYLPRCQVKCHSWNPAGKDHIEYAFAKMALAWEHFEKLNRKLGGSEENS